MWLFEPQHGKDLGTAAHQNDHQSFKGVVGRRGVTMTLYPIGSFLRKLSGFSTFDRYDDKDTAL